MKNLFLILLLAVSSLSAQVTVSTLCGSKEGGFADGPLNKALFYGAFGICIDSKGSIIIAENGSHLIREIDTKGNVRTIAGTGQEGLIDFKWDKSQFNGPSGVCADAEGNIYIADFLNHAIRKLGTDWMVTTIAGNGKPGYKNGKGAEAQFNYPRGICIDKKGNLYVGDSWNHRIRKIDAEGNVTTYAGGGNYFNPDSIGDCVDGPDTTARFYTPCGVSCDDDGNVYVADARNHRIRKIDTKRFVTTIAGMGKGGVETGGFADGRAEVSRLNTPTEVCAGNDGTVYFSDTYGNRIRKIFNGEVTTIAGTGKAGFKNGPGNEAEFNFPRGIAADKKGKKIYVFDYNNNCVRVIEGNF